MSNNVKIHWIGIKINHQLNIFKNSNRLLIIILKYIHFQKKKKYTVHLDLNFTTFVCIDFQLYIRDYNFEKVIKLFSV